MTLRFFLSLLYYFLIERKINRKIDILKYILLKRPKKIFGIILPETSKEINSQLYSFIFDVTQKHLKINSPKIIVDMGASYGIVSSVYSKQYPDALIYAFEPNKKAFEYAQKLFSRNALNNIFLFNVAVGDDNKEIEFYVNPGHFESASVFSNEFNAGTKQVVRMVDVNAFFDSNKFSKIDFLKIDIEGMEFKLMEHLHKERKLDIVQNIFIEVHLNYSDYESTRFSRLLNIIEENKFYYKISSTGSDKGIYYRLLLWGSKTPL